MDSAQELAQQISQRHAEIYYRVHPQYTVPLSHQAVRVLQFVSFEVAVHVDDIAKHLHCPHNNASEIVRRLAEKGLVIRQRSLEDERIVHVRLTDSGIQALNEHTALDQEKLVHSLDKMTKQEQAQVQQGFDILLSYILAEEKR